ncbi:7899_t:CDS:2 [Rhizophagus irregularis]|nr:7899_t:CDS:2 [Rhizophagus irregularis]
MKYHGSLKVKIFEISDYDLNKDERQEKYKDYYVLLCEKCNQEVNKRDYKCNNCYNMETDPNEFVLDLEVQAEEQKNPSYNFDETIDNTLNSSITMKTHSQAIYKSKILDLPSHLPEPSNCSNLIIQNVQAEKLQSECLECAIPD